MKISEMYGLKEKVYDYIKLNQNNNIDSVDITSNFKDVRVDIVMNVLGELQKEGKIARNGNCISYKYVAL